MKHISKAVFAILAFGLGSARAAEGWGIPNEKPLIVQGKVVDILCHLTGQCVPQCGAGKRQLGILTREGVLRMVAKGNVDFANAVPDLAPLCGQEVEADGLIIENPAITLYFVQGIRTKPGDAFTPADVFLKDWTAKNGAAEEWWRKDPEANRLIAEKGPFGIPGLTPPPPKQ